MQQHHILLIKESAPDEARVSLVPADVARLVAHGHTVAIESGAGERAGFSDQVYQQAGANIRQHNGDYAALFAGITLLVRAKRPNREREQAEAQALQEGMIMLGALDPFAKEGHLEEYRRAKITAYSIDQLPLPRESPMNLLANMSVIAGELALLDALEKAKTFEHNQGVPPQKVMIVGTGTAGLAAYGKAVALGHQVVVVSTNAQLVAQFQTQHSHTPQSQIPKPPAPSNNAVSMVYLDKKVSLETQQQLIKNIAVNADVVITTARQAGARAPLLFPVSTLQAMRSGSVIVDLALSEGGNVEGSHHDQTLRLGNAVMVTNVSGYPKVRPHEASLKWSLATRLFIEALVDPEPSQQALVTAAMTQPRKAACKL